MSPSLSALLHPKRWFTWLLFGFWYLLSLLPYRLQIFLGRGVGVLLYHFVKSRRIIAETNIALCFPRKSQAEQTQLVRDVMGSIGIAFFETGMAWFWPRWRLKRIYTVEGLEHLEEAQAAGVGVVLMAFHFTHIDIGAKLLGMSVSIDGTYRPHKNPVYDLVQRWGRERLTQQGTAIARGDVRAMIKALRKGRFIWYAADQDFSFNVKHSIFVPLFGIQASTMKATSELARIGKARVIPFTQTRKADGSGYHVHIRGPVADFPSGDIQRDTRCVNEVVERCISEQPEQYLWVHRRFKTRPEGEPSLYPEKTRKPK